MAIPFTHYIAGIRSGIYPAFPRPTFSKSNSLQDIFYEEYQREYARKLVRGPSSNRTKSEFRIPSFLPYFPTGLPSFPSTTQLDITQISNQIPRLNSDDVFGLVEELCHECGVFKEVQIHFDRSRAGQIRQNHASCATGNIQSKSHEIVLSNPVLQRDMSRNLLKPRIAKWTFGYAGILVFPMSCESTKITICMGEDTNRSVTILQTEDSTIKMNDSVLTFYNWLKASLERPWWNALLEEDIDSFTYLAGNKTWFFLKLFDGHHESQKCYFVMLIKYQANYFPGMADIL
jgi:hypothetical protein